MITKEEAKELRKEISQLGQNNTESDIYHNYMPSEITEEQAIEEGLSIINIIEEE